MTTKKGRSEDLVAAGFAGELFVEAGLGFGGLLGLLASRHDGGSEAGGKLVGELVGLLVTVDIDGFASGVDDHFAVVAGPEVLFDFSKEIRFDLAVEEVG
jgi:hypothetical protein